MLKKITWYKPAAIERRTSLTLSLLSSWRKGAALLGLNEVEDAYAIYSHGILKSNRLEGTTHFAICA
jgi:hypothetical protein